MNESELQEKISARSFEDTLKLVTRYNQHFVNDAGLGLNDMPLEDLARLEEIVEECIATGKPYDNYMPYPDDENMLVDY